MKNKQRRLVKRPLGEIKVRGHVVAGIEKFAETFTMLSKGQHFDKLALKEGHE
jgi:NADPH-dependent curcumin reductase CurA